MNEQYGAVDEAAYRIVLSGQPLETGREAVLRGTGQEVRFILGSGHVFHRFKMAA